ncbi:MAG: LLM class flavin-dependent oxidoreductase [Sphaerobacteraceae bacterium]|nr:MAG: LLM class flavin-dependent oxidoreductase [Sphaerobacteraceae bacterium]
MIGGPTHGGNPPADTITFGIVAGQHNRTLAEMREQWQFAEDTGWDSAWAFDHFFSLRDDEMGPCLDGWTLLGGMAERTERVQMGLMVTGLTHRNPAVLFKQAVTVDHLSGGRLIFGIGASWNDREHEAYGIEFPSPKVRVDRFGEAMEMFRQLETQERTTFEGEHYSLVNAPFEPKPVFGHMPVLVGSRGKRMMRYIAKYADQWDGNGSPEEYAEHSRRLDENCREIGRDPSEIRRGLTTDAGLESEDAFRQHVADYWKAGVRTFLARIPTGSVNQTLQNIAEKVIPELREQYNGS